MYIFVVASCCGGGSSLRVSVVGAGGLRGGTRAQGGGQRGGQQEAAGWREGTEGAHHKEPHLILGWEGGFGSL